MFTVTKTNWTDKRPSTRIHLEESINREKINDFANWSNIVFDTNNWTAIVASMLSK